MTPSEGAGAEAGPWSHQGRNRLELVPWPGKLTSLSGRSREAWAAAGRPSAAETCSPSERPSQGPRARSGDPGPATAGSVPGATPGAAQRPLSLLLGGLGPRPMNRRRRKPPAGAWRGRWVCGASAEPQTAGSSPALLSCTAPGSRPQPEPRATLTASRPHRSLPMPRQEAGVPHAHSSFF